MSLLVDICPPSPPTLMKPRLVLASFPHLYPFVASILSLIYTATLFSNRPVLDHVTILVRLLLPSMLKPLPFSVQRQYIARLRPTISHWEN